MIIGIMKNKFNRHSRNNPAWTSLTTFNNMILLGEIKDKSDINKWFDQLVDKKDYPRSLRDSILEYSYSLL